MNIIETNILSYASINDLILVDVEDEKIVPVVSLSHSLLQFYCVINVSHTPVELINIIYLIVLLHIDVITCFRYIH